jgi:flagellar motor switch protein FliM
MSNEILSQEEIDALLGAMDKGEVDLETDSATAVETEAYDITSQEVHMRDDFDALGEVYEKFTRRVKATLEARLQTGVAIQLASTSIVKYGDFIGAHTHPTGFGIFSMAPLIGKGLMVFDAQLFFILMDCLAGGSGKPPKKIRDFTPIESGIMRRLFAEVLTDLEKAWEVVYAVKIALTKDETNPEFLHVADPADLMLVNQYDIKVNSSSSKMHVCFPYLMLDAIKDELSSSYMQSKNTEQVYKEKLQQTLGLTPVTVIAELGKSLHTVRDILQLKQNDVITLDKGPQDHVTVSVESVPKFQGMAGIAKGNRAVHIFDMTQ